MSLPEGNGLIAQNNFALHDLEEIVKKLQNFLKEHVTISVQQSIVKTDQLKFLDLLVNQSFDILSIINPDENIRFINKAAKRYLDYSQDELIGQSIIDFIHRDDIPRFRLEFQKLKSSSRGEIFLPGIRLKQRDGSWRTFELLGKKSENNVHDIHLVICFRELAIRKASEHKLNEKQRMEALGFIARSIAHDFRNIMAVILGAAQMIEMNPEHPEIRKYLEMIVSSVSRGNAVVKKMLAFSDTPKSDCKTCHAIDFLERFVDDFKSRLPENIDISTKIYTQNDLILADTDHLNQILTNLCENSIEATQDSGGTIVLGLEEPLPAVGQPKTEYNLEKYVCITVTDNGQGMSKKVLSNALKPFYSTKETGDGVGLGLSMVYNLVQQHNGWIEIQSEKDVGTKVTIGLQRSEVKEVGLAPGFSATMGKSADKEKHILVVEDESHLRELLAEILKTKGYIVSVAANGKDGLNIFKSSRHDIDVVLTDLKMPIMNGYELEQEIHQINPYMKILGITGSIGAKEMPRSYLQGFDALIEKPFDIPEIIETIRKILT